MAINIQYGSRRIPVCAPYASWEKKDVYLDLDIGAYIDSDRVPPLQTLFSHDEVGVSVVTCWDNETEWMRDIVVQRPDGTVLVPYCLQKNATIEKVQELTTFLFHGMNKKWSFQSTPLENGLFITHEGQIKAVHTSTGGGNVIFWTINGRKGAFVGLSVVFATMAALVQSGVFKTSRHLDIENEKFAFGERIFLLGSYQQRMSFFENNESYRQEYEQHWQPVFTTIAHDLGVSEEDLIILYHSALHIDLHVLVGPNSFGQGKIYLHDPAKTVMKLNELRDVFGIHNNNDFSDFDQEIDAQSEEIRLNIFEKNKEILENEGFIVEGIVGRIDTLLPLTGYFINGLMCTNRQNEHFFLTGSLTQTCKDVKKVTESGCSLLGFSEMHLLVEEMVMPLMNDGITVIFIDYFGGYGGGLHCLTNEYRVREARHLPPQSIPVDSCYFPSTITTQIEVLTNVEELWISIRDIPHDEKTVVKYLRNIWLSESKGILHIFTFDVLVPVTGLHYSWQIGSQLFIEQQKLYPGHHQIRKLYA